MKPTQDQTDSGLHLGDILTAKVHYGLEGGVMLPPEKGRVVYIHPEGRFFTLEFTFPKGTFRESYPLKSRITAPMWGAEPTENGPARGPQNRWLKSF